ncbi:BLUF domain-containing protein [Paracoccus sp. WLY502]|uniref:BLUF domain-containing protein n=1 Tax=Paracoccus yibinensis TaxID=3068891 RepID=UPI002796AB44|nr:BLUF domain-containing protein [Paracoccus sp. WLY502]MDQ1902655.1 BLUF domain-containing protein [Paracoccus sp. WLY502]
MIAILYRSEAKTAADGNADQQILSAAQVRNTSLNVTGFLYREDDVFYQWLEGPADAVRQIFSSILKDPRHHQVKKLSEIPISNRSFRPWPMAYSDGSIISLFDWAAETDISLQMVRPDQILSFLLFCALRV